MKSVNRAKQDAIRGMERDPGDRVACPGLPAARDRPYSTRPGRLVRRIVGAPLAGALLSDFTPCLIRQHSLVRAGGEQWGCGGPWAERLGDAHALQITYSQAISGLEPFSGRLGRF